MRAAPAADDVMRSSCPRPTPNASLPTRADLVRRGDGAAATQALEARLQAGERVPFFPNSVAERTERNPPHDREPRYVLHVFGFLETGAKAHVILRNIRVSFDVRIPEGAEAPATKAQLITLLEGSGLAPDEVRQHRKFPLMGWQETPATYLELAYGHAKARRQALETLWAAGYETAEDDLGSSYYPKASRTHGFPLASWATLADYSWQRGGAHPSRLDDPAARKRSPLCEHVFELPGPEGYAPAADPADPAAPPSARAPARDRTLVLAWDIETYTARPEKDLPRGENAEDCVFMIGLSLHWKDEEAPLCQVCLAQGAPADPDPRWATVLCGSERELLRAFAGLLGQFAPDLVVGFNDGDYDWPFVLKKAAALGVLGPLADAATALPGWGATSTEDAQKFNVAKAQVKLGDQVWPVSYLRVSGWVAIDVRVEYMKLFPAAETGGMKSSLAFFLARSNLPPKVDMPHTELWRVYELKDAAGMRRAAEYCVNDAERCVALLRQKNVVAERREIAALAYVALVDAVLRAHGHKVLNLIGAYAARAGFRGSFRVAPASDDERKFPGAQVFPPEKGLVPDPTAPGSPEMEAVHALGEAWGGRLAPRAAVRIHGFLAPPVRGLPPPNPQMLGYRPGRPVAGLDFSSLYPSVISAYNLSPEKFVATRAQAEDLENAGAQVHKVSFTMVGDSEPTRGWFLRTPPPGRRQSAPPAKGLYPQVLDTLYEQRAAIKKALAARQAAGELMDLAIARRANGQEWPFAAEKAAAEEAGAPPLLVAALGAAIGAPDAEARYMAFYHENRFAAQNLDAKQKALKVFMNTFYGEAGSRTSASYLLLLAGGVTEAGRHNIRLAADYVRSRGCHLLYGDTDSIYVSPPEKLFAELDLLYACGQLGREAYWSRMVEAVMKATAALRDALNAHIAADNGTTRLRMDYEEVLYPHTFTGKKKYFALAHVLVPNFRPKDIFIRGINVQRGVSTLSRKPVDRIMRRALSLDNTQPLGEIVRSELAAALDPAQWAFEDFVMTACWNPKKNNRPVVQYVQRMEERRARDKEAIAARIARSGSCRPLDDWVPKPGERFSYVLRRRADTHSLEGQRLETKKGLLMEPAELARRDGLQPDVGEYVALYVVGPCARLLNFQYEKAALAKGVDPEDARALDEKCQDLAAADLQRYLAGLLGNGGGDARALSRQYKQAYGHASRARAQIPLSAAAEWAFLGQDLALPAYRSRRSLEAAVTALADGHWQALAGELLLPPARSLQERRLALRARALGIGPRGEDLGEPSTAARPRLFQAVLEHAPPSGQKRHPAFRDRVTAALERIEEKLRAQLVSLAEGVAPAALRYEARFEELVRGWREATIAGCDGPAFAYALAPEEEEDLAALRKAFRRLRGLHIARQDRRAFAPYLHKLKVLRRGDLPAPSPAQRALAIAAQQLTPLGFDVQGGALHTPPALARPQ